MKKYFCDKCGKKAKELNGMNIKIYKNSIYQSIELKCVCDECLNEFMSLVVDWDKSDER